MKRILAAAALGLLAACALMTPPAPAPDAPVSTPVSAEAAACAAQNGVIRPVCRLQRPACVIAYADAGKTCRNDTDCAGKCLLQGDVPATPGVPVTGQCQASSDPCGCRTEVDGGKVKATLCVD